MTAHPIVAGVDIDDVIYPWYYRAHELCVEAGLVSAEILPTTWYPYEEYGVTLQEWIDVLGDATISGELYFGNPIEGAVEALRDLEQAGVRIEYITARGSMAHADLIKSQTREWVDSWLPEGGLHFSQRGAWSKPQIATALGVTHFIDDTAHNVADMVSDAPHIRTYLQERPWNADYPHALRVKNLAEFSAALTRGEHPWLNREVTKTGRPE